MKKFLYALLMSVCISNVAFAQVTNPFEDLKRKGAVKEENSEMRIVATAEHKERLLQEKPISGFFCFAEDRMHDIRLKNDIPECMAIKSRDSRMNFNGESQPGEYYVWQIGVYAPYYSLENVTLDFSNLKGDNGDKIKSSEIQCINTDGRDVYGKVFHKTINIEKGNIQPLWIGISVPKTAKGLYKGTVRVRTNDGKCENININLNVKGKPISDNGDNEGWRKSRLAWLNSDIGIDETPTQPYTALVSKKNKMSWLGGDILLSNTGLPSAITTKYDINNNLASEKNPILAKEMNFVIETPNGQETLKGGKLRITKKSATEIQWKSKQRNNNFEILCLGKMGFDGIANVSLQVKAKHNIKVKDIRLEIPYTEYASKYMMGLGHKGGYRPNSLITWKWDVNNHQDKIWMGNVNAGLNIRLMDNNFVRPLVNIYYSLGKLNLPESWGNQNRGGIKILPSTNEVTRLIAYSGEREMKKNQVEYFNFDLQITPVKPIDLKKHVEHRFYHSNSDVSTHYISEAKKYGATEINIHHKKDVYPFINYPYYDEATSDLAEFINKAHSQNLGVRLYYTTRELTAKIPELWALRSLGGEVIHDGPGKDTRTLIHPNGPNQWLINNLGDHFIPAWYNVFKKGKFAGDMDVSVITTPDSRWNNYYLAGLDFLVNKLKIDGIYVDDSALDRITMQRARRILDADGKSRLIDLHSWNHMNKWAGYANSIHLYTELLPYIDRTWIGEGFVDSNTKDFWLVEMSGIPFGLMSATLQASNKFRGLIFGMLPRLPWSGNPVPLWKLFDEFKMQNASMHGYWDPNSPVKSDNPDLPITVYTNGDEALVVIANWTDLPQKAKIEIDEDKLGFKPSVYELPEIRDLQWGGKISNLKQCEILGRSGLIIWLKK